MIASAGRQSQGGAMLNSIQSEALGPCAMVWEFGEPGAIELTERWPAVRGGA